MTELTKLSPELEKKISIYEDLLFVVKGPGDRNGMISAIKTVKTTRADVVAFFKPQKDAINKAKEELMKIINPLTDRCDAIEKNAKRAILIYDSEQENIRLVEQARLQAIEDERARKEQERLLKQADKLKSPERSEALIEEAANIVAPVVQVAEPEKNKGESTRKIWRGRVVDPDKVSDIFKIIDQKAIDKYAIATKGAVPMEGVEFYEESILAITM